MPSENNVPRFRTPIALLRFAGAILSLIGADVADAGSNAGGVLLLHANPTLSYTSDVASYCGLPNLSNCAEATTRVDGAESVVFHVIAAFAADAHPYVRGVEFGIQYDADVLVMVAHRSCFDFELGTDDWPAPGSGTAISLTKLGRATALVEVYWFAAYRSGADTTSFALGPHPVHGGSFADGFIPSNLDPIAGYGRLGFGIDGELPCPAGADAPGACCLPTGVCELRTDVACAKAGGQFSGRGVPCGTELCEPFGACCNSHGRCSVVMQSECEGRGKLFVGPGTACDPDPCPEPKLGACCTPDSCWIIPEWACRRRNAWYLGDDTTCEPNACSSSGACCFDNDECRKLTPEACAAANGTFLGSDVACDWMLCLDGIGACCFENGDCRLTNELRCMSRDGLFLGVGSNCDAVKCTVRIGACCVSNPGGCVYVNEARCVTTRGTYLGDGSTCDPDPCPSPIGACCFDDRHCETLSLSECHDNRHGDFVGAAVACDPNPCEPTPTGACCKPDGECVVLDPHSCAQLGAYMGDGSTCVSAPCVGRIKIRAGER